VGEELLSERHAAQIEGVLGCFDRMLIFGTLPGICFAGGMTSFLFERKIRIFDYPKFAEPYRNRIRENAEQMAAKGGVEIEFIRKRNFRKEDRVNEIIAKARRAGGSGVHLLGDGALFDVPAMAQQANRQDVPGAG
jgi:hypothetical protein